MRKIGLWVLLILNLIPTVHSNDDNAAITYEAYPPKLHDLVLVDTLVYNKSGNINALAWSLTNVPTATNTSQNYHHPNYFLVAASVTTFQVWNGTIPRKNDNNQSDASIIQWGIEQIIPSNNIGHAVAFSPNGKWLALGTYLEAETYCL